MSQRCDIGCVSMTLSCSIGTESHQCLQAARSGYIETTSKESSKLGEECGKAISGYHITERDNSQVLEKVSTGTRASSMRLVSQDIRECRNEFQDLKGHRRRRLTTVSGYGSCLEMVPLCLNSTSWAWRSRDATDCGDQRTGHE